MNTAQLLPPLTFRQRVSDTLDRPWIQNLLLGLILLNAVILGAETYPPLVASTGELLHRLDNVILGIFVVEIALRIYAHRGAFFKDAWSLFDFAVIAIALVPTSGPFAVLRALRVLRVLRVLTFVPSMKKIVGALVQSLNGMLSIAMVLGLIYYVAAVITTKLFGASFPDWFGSLGKSLYTLFQVMTLESWSMGIARPVMEQYPLAWAFFVPFILVATFTMLNLFIAVIVNAVQSMHDEEHKQEIDDKHALQQALLAQMQELKAEIAALRQQQNKASE